MAGMLDELQDLSRADRGTPPPLRRQQTDLVERRTASPRTARSGQSD
jgi:hypothetical protein